MEKQSIVRDKSFEFSLSIIDLYMKLKKQNEFEISKQILRSGTSIGANVEEGLAGYSKKDFAAKMGIASKEARETRYWLRLLEKSDHFKMDVKQHLKDCEELIKMLTSIVKTTQIKLTNTTKIKDN
jgi:four helix bundle protein